MQRLTLKMYIERDQMHDYAKVLNLHGPLYLQVGFGIRWLLLF